MKKTLSLITLLGWGFYALSGNLFLVLAEELSLQSPPPLEISQESGDLEITPPLLEEASSLLPEDSERGENAVLLDEENKNIDENLSEGIFLFSEVLTTNSELLPLMVFVSKTKKCEIDDQLSFEDACETIDLNTSSSSQLQKLCGVGSSTANNILNFLQTDSFTTLSDLTKVSGIGNTTLQNITNLNQQCQDKQTPTPPPFSSSPEHLLISEVYYDDYVFTCSEEDIEDRGCSEEDHEEHLQEERIEIFNSGDQDFQGSFSLSGGIYEEISSFFYEEVFIPAKGYLILANALNPLKIPENLGIVKNTDAHFPLFSIPDDKALLVELRGNDALIDSFSAQESRVKQRDDSKTSFQKLLLPNKTIITNAWEHATNNPRGYKVNPGLIVETDDDGYVDYGIPKYTTPEDSDLPELCEDALSDTITLTEVFRGGERYDPYLEFFIHEDIEEEFEFLQISGSLLAQSITIDLTQETESYDASLLEKNTRLILTKEVGELSEAGLLTLVYHPDFDLHNPSGELEIYGIYGQSSQLLDMVHVVSGSFEKSSYFHGLQRNCGDNIDFVDDFSPGFGQEVLRYFSPTSTYNIKVVETVKYVGGGGGGSYSCTTKEELCGSAPSNNSGTVEKIEMKDDDPPYDEGLDEVGQGDGGGSENTTDGTSPLPPYEGGQLVKIVGLEYLSPESITLQSFLPYGIDFSKRVRYLKTSTSSTKKYIEGELSANSIDTFTKTFGFVDTGGCVDLYSGAIIIDSYCRSPEKTSSEKEETPQLTFNPLLYQLKITDILYDPPGADAGNETITIQNLSSHDLDLSQLKLKINTTNKKLSGTLLAGETKTFQGTFGFPNSTKEGSEVLVSLFYNDTIFSTYLYNPNTPKVEVQSGTVKVFSVLDGDTFRFRKEDGTLQSVRLLGVDAPESTTTRYRTTECFGQESKKYLTELIKNQYVRLEYDATQQQVDSYGRLLAYVYLDEVLVNEKMLLDGYAKEYTYKSAYQKQSDFQSAESSAKSSAKGLWSSATCGVSIDEVPEARGVDYALLDITITSIDYDPEGSDKDNESLFLSIDASALPGLSEIDFSDNFKLTIFPREEYATGTTKNKNLSSFGLLPLTSPLQLKGDFALPNSKATCISLKYQDYIFDTSCYNPGAEREEIVHSGTVKNLSDSSLPNIKITSLLPNPSGADKDKEEITLFWTPNLSLRTEGSNPENEGERQDVEWIATTRFSGSRNDETLNLSPDFYLLINNKTKKKLNGILLPNQEITIKGSFSFPNTASCVTLMKGSDPIDSFCYGKAADGVRFTSDNQQVKDIPDEELAVVKKITLVKKDDQLCISYNKVLFGCKKIPNSTTLTNQKLLSFQNNYIAQLQNYLKKDYSLLYYNSEVRDYFDFYSQGKKDIKAGEYSMIRKGKEVPLTNVASSYPLQYKQNAESYLTSKVVEALPASLLNYYKQEREKWRNELMEK
ncbi:MAG: thermonuclease family protein [Candidatus Absconditabacteria bacterium]|nr:thermonuclease family protein [Candidatus Absconditabacteria bacterium]MDD3868682.1 thermonuclease family protein [Candidatus Absconditabacteria bacterium]